MHTRADRRRSAIAYIILAVFVFITVFPVLSVATFAFLPETALKQYPPQLIPDSLDFENFSFVLRNTTILKGMRNSAVVVVGAVLCVLAIGSVGAYGAAKSSPKYRGFVYGLLLLTQMVPAMANMIPIYSMLMKLNLINSLWGIILIYTVNTLPLSMLILLGFFKSSIAELEEAAMIDGCNWWQAFVYISLPIAKPGLVSAVIFTFAMSWNEFMMSRLIVTDPQMMTYQATLYDVMNTYVVKNSKYNYLSAAALMGLIPILVVYCTFQRGFTEGITAGSIK